MEGTKKSVYYMCCGNTILLYTDNSDFLSDYVALERRIKALRYIRARTAIAAFNLMVIRVHKKNEAKALQVIKELFERDGVSKLSGPAD